MTDHVQLSYRDYPRIEAEARRMRAEAIREMFSALGRALSGLFAHKSARREA